MRDNANQGVCEEIAGELRELAKLRSTGNVSEDAFTMAVLSLEELRLQKHGITLSASNTIDDWTVFKLRYGRGTICAAFEFLPETGEFREVGSGPRRLEGATVSS
jgi:hypothetical protein